MGKCLWIKATVQENFGKLPFGCAAASPSDITRLSISTHRPHLSWTRNCHVSVRNASGEDCSQRRNATYLDARRKRLRLVRQPWRLNCSGFADGSNSCIGWSIISTTMTKIFP